MVASVGSLSSELETGTDTSHHLLYKKFKYIPKDTVTSPKSREEIDKMSGNETQTAPNTSITSPEGRTSSSTMKSPISGDRNSTSPEAKGERILSPLHTTLKDRPAYMIRWNRFEEQVCSAFAELFCSDHFVDVTLACDGEMMKAHKIVLAMSSPFFRRIFQETPCKHPVVIIKGMTPKTLRSVLQYIYLGEVTLNKNEINGFMDAADYLSICGVFANLYSCDISTTSVPVEGRQVEDTDVEQDYEKPPSSDGEKDLRTTSESDGQGPSAFRDDSQSEQEENSSHTQSNVIKYHGIKSRWSRRYSNTSFHGTPTAGSPVETDNKRSASAGEIETALEPESMIIPKETEAAGGQDQKLISESQTEMEVTTQSGEDDKADGSDDADSVKERRIIQRAHPKYYMSSFEEGSDAFVEDVKDYTPPPQTSSPPSGRSRGLPYTIGTKDFSHPLQVAVDPHPHPSTHFGGPNTASSGGGKVESAVRVKSHSGFTVYSSPHSHPSQGPLFRAQSEAEFPITSSPASLLASHHYRGDERSMLKSQQTYRHHSQHPHHIPRHHHQHHLGNDHPPSRPHLPLLSSQSSWSFSEHQRSRGPPPPMEDAARDVNEFRFRSNSVEREFANYGGAKEFFSHSNQLMGLPDFASKSHSYPTATDLSVSGMSQQYSHLGFMPQLKSPSSSAAATRPKTKAIRSSQVPQSARYTAAEVDQMVDAVANYPGNIVPCTLCQKFVKRERLRAHIHECHLLSGEKIICPHCGIALKSKGSFRVHIWRHKRGALPTRNTLTDFGRDRPPSPQTGPASH